MSDHHDEVCDTTLSLGIGLGNSLPAKPNPEEPPKSRKRLRLLRPQALVLEDHFKNYGALTNEAKDTLAATLHLKPRQVEVWFQNQRARTRAKQTKDECEKWKKSCKELMEKNNRLTKENEELRELLKLIRERAACSNCGRLRWRRY